MRVNPTLRSCIALIREDFAEYCVRCGFGSKIKAAFLLTFFHRGYQLALSLRIQQWLTCIPIFGAIIRRVLAYVTSLVTGAEVSFVAEIGGGIFFPHPSGVVVGDNWRIGKRVTIMQGVTLGARRVEKGKVTTGVIGDMTIVSTGAVIFDDVVIGSNVVVGANAVVLTSVPSDSTAVGVPAKVAVRQRS
jgi:serine O-acetyltransferase